MYVVTGGAGFIGSNLVKGLNRQGFTNIIVVDDLTDGTKFKNLVDCQILDYVDKDEFISKFQTNKFNDPIEAIFHQGACSTTTEWDGRFMMENNYEYSKKILHQCLDNQIPFIYASSAAVYGLTNKFEETPAHEAPLNVYGYSKLQFDRYVRGFLHQTKSQVVGLRYFNVFGPGESHKGTMASVVYHFYHQLKKQGSVNLFEGTNGYENGEQRRDFIFVEDIVKANLWFLEQKAISGIYNVGTGESRSFNDVARAVVNFFGKGQINYIPFPEHLRGCYQNFTQADLTQLKNQGYNLPFTSLEQGVKQYLHHLDKHE